MTNKRKDDSSDINGYYTGLRNSMMTVSKLAGDEFARRLDPESATLYFHFKHAIMDSDASYRQLLDRAVDEVLMQTGLLDQYRHDLARLIDRKKEIRASLEDKYRDKLVQSAEIQKQEFLKYIQQRVAEKTLPSFYSASGGLSMFSANDEDPTNQRQIFRVSHPEMTKIINWEDGIFVNPYLTGEPGSGKTNLAVLIVDAAIRTHKGQFIDPAAIDALKSNRIDRGTLRVYFPNILFQQDDGRPYQHSHAYSKLWEIFLDEPRGSSILWTKHDQILNDVNNMGIKKESLYSIIYLGEMGKGQKMGSGVSRQITSFLELVQRLRQIGIKLIGSGVYLPADVLVDKFDPLIVMNVTMGEAKSYKPDGDKTYTAQARYWADNKQGYRTVDLGIVPLHPFTKVLNRGIALDTSGLFDEMPISAMLEQSGATRAHTLELMRDAITEMSNLVMDAAGISSRMETENGDPVGVKAVEAKERKRREHKEEDVKEHAEFVDTGEVYAPDFWK